MLFDLEPIQSLEIADDGSLEEVLCACGCILVIDHRDAEFSAFALACEEHLEALARYTVEVTE